MKHHLYVDLNTRGRLWLEMRAIPLPDPIKPGDVAVRIEQHYPGGRAAFMLDVQTLPRIEPRDGVRGQKEVFPWRDVIGSAKKHPTKGNI